MTSEHIIYTLLTEHGLQIRHCRRSIAPLPFAADVICATDEADLGLMLNWCRHKIRKGYDAARLRRECDGAE